MATFQLIQKGDKVFDSIQQIIGIVTSINYTTNVAEIDTHHPSSDEELILSKLANLTVLGKSDYPKHSEGFNKLYDQVKEFQDVFGHPVAHTPAPLSLERMTDRKTWEFEEGVEAIHASSKSADEFNKAVDNLIQGVEKAREKSLKEEFPQDDLSRLVAQADAITDGSYFLTGDFVELGLKPDKLFDIVQNSNMSKLFVDEDGNKYAKYRESDGKILKSENFFPPEPALEAEIKRQLRK